MTPQKWQRIDPCGSGLKHGDLLLETRGKVMLTLPPASSPVEGGGYFAAGWFGGYLSAWSCTRGLTNVFKIAQRFS